MGIFQDCCTSFQDCCQENCGCCGEKPATSTTPAVWQNGTPCRDSAPQGPFPPPPPPRDYNSGLQAGGHRRSPHQEPDEPEREATVKVPSSDAFASSELEKPLILEQPQVNLPRPPAASAPETMQEKEDLSNGGEFSKTKEEKKREKAHKKKQLLRDEKAEAEKRREAAAAEQKRSEQAKDETAPVDAAQSVTASSHVQPIQSSNSSVNPLADQLKHLAVSPPKVKQQGKKKHKKQGSKLEQREKSTLSASLPDHQSKLDASATHKEIVKDLFKPDDDGFKYDKHYIKKIAKGLSHHSTLASPSAA